MRFIALLGLVMMVTTVQAQPSPTPLPDIVINGHLAWKTEMYFAPDDESGNKVPWDIAFTIRGMHRKNRPLTLWVKKPGEKWTEHGRTNSAGFRFTMSPNAFRGGKFARQHRLLGTWRFCFTTGGEPTREPILTVHVVNQTLSEMMRQHDTK